VQIAPHVTQDIQDANSFALHMETALYAVQMSNAKMPLPELEIARLRHKC
jgi:hypothetical protein